MRWEFGHRVDSSFIAWVRLGVVIVGATFGSCLFIEDFLPVGLFGRGYGGACFGFGHTVSAKEGSHTFVDCCFHLALVLVLDTHNSLMKPHLHVSPPFIGVPVFNCPSSVCPCVFAL
jgi:hypothetical protein